MQQHVYIVAGFYTHQGGTLWYVIVMRYLLYQWVSRIWGPTKRDFVAHEWKVCRICELGISTQFSYDNGNFTRSSMFFSEARRELLCWKWAQWNSCALKGFSSTSSLWWFILDIFSNHKFIEKKSTNKNSSKCLRDFGFHKGFEVLHWFSKNLPPFRFGTTPQTLASHNSGSLERRFLMAFLGKENRPCFCLRFPKKDTRNAG